MGISQPTVSRIYRRLRRVLAAVAEAGAVGLADVGEEELLLVVDACLLPVGERAGHQELYSGKRHASGVNVQARAAVGRTIALLKQWRSSRRGVGVRCGWFQR